MQFFFQSFKLLFILDLLDWAKLANLFIDLDQLLAQIEKNPMRRQLFANLFQLWTHPYCAISL